MIARAGLAATLAALAALCGAALVAGCGDDAVAPRPALTAPDFAFIGEPEPLANCSNRTGEGSGEGGGGGGGEGSGEGSGGEGSGQPSDGGCSTPLYAGGVDGGAFFAGGAARGCGALGAQAAGGNSDGDGVVFWDGGGSSGSGEGSGDIPSGGGVDFGGWGDVGIPDFDGGTDAGGDAVGDLCCYLADCPDGPDPECPFVCGDGIRTRGYETCDGDDCPTECDQPTDECSPVLARALVGTPERCDVQCIAAPRPCTSDDGCCNFEVGCTWLNDTDCPTPTGEVGSPCLGDDDCGVAETLMGCLDQANDGLLGGYCTMTTFGACPTGSHLSQYGGPLQFNCVKDCTSDADCRDRGYACVDSDYDGSRECAPFAQGDLALGEACTGYWECAGGNHIGCAVSAFGGPDGKFCTAWCNPARNREQGECPDRMLCMSGRCFPSEEICFTGDGLCPVNKYCTVDEDADCAGINAEVGEPCEETADCGLSVDVYCSDEADGFPDGYCMVQGGVIVDCPDGSDFNNDFIHGNSLLSQCWLECDADSDCRGPDYECYAPYFRGSNVCAPAGTGTRAVGSPCSSTADCAGGQYHLCLDGYCAQLCDLTAAESGCPAGTRCGAADFVCRAECDDTSECPAGFDCVARMCLPQRE